MLSNKDRSSLAGEFYTLAELYKRGHNAFITLGKAKQIDIVVKKNNKSLAIEVKAKMSNAQFLPKPVSDNDTNKIWCFVDLYAKDFPNNSPKFYLISAKDLRAINKKRLNDLEERKQETGREYNSFSLQDVRLSDLTKFLNNWDLIDKELT
ncbi:MAG: hypothetical protein HZB85_03895 [Deltaproteobacteria bacterium]|nr:hypothetical protein [Deltaproteobacteria bacterium]